VLFFGGAAAALVGVLESVFSTNSAEASTAVTAIVASVNVIGLGGILVVLTSSDMVVRIVSTEKKADAPVEPAITQEFIAFMEHRKTCSWCQRGQTKCPTGKAILQGNTP
jgi:hypothetical protein